MKKAVHYSRAATVSGVAFNQVNMLHCDIMNTNIDTRYDKSTYTCAYRYLLRDCINPSISLASNLHIEVALDIMESISCKE